MSKHVQVSAEMQQRTMSIFEEASLTLPEHDVKRLTALLMTRVGLAYRAEACDLLRKLRRAKVVGAASIAADVVTMSSTVSFEVEGEREARTVTLVYPWRAHEPTALSVLSSLGTALLGLRAGEHATWTLAEGSAKRLVVRDVTYQPEAEGHWHL